MKRYYLNTIFLILAIISSLIILGGLLWGMFVKRNFSIENDLLIIIFGFIISFMLISIVTYKIELYDNQWKFKYLNLGIQIPYKNILYISKGWMFINYYMIFVSHPKSGKETMLILLPVQKGMEFLKVMKERYTDLPIDEKLLRKL